MVIAQVEMLAARCPSGDAASSYRQCRRSQIKFETSLGLRRPHLCWRVRPCTVAAAAPHSASRGSSSCAISAPSLYPFLSCAAHRQPVFCRDYSVTGRFKQRLMQGFQGRNF